MKSKRFLSPMLVWFVLLTLCMAGIGAIAVTNAVRLSRMQQSQVPLSTHLEDVSVLSQRIGSVEHQVSEMPAALTTLSPQEQLDKEILRQLAQKDIFQKSVHLSSNNVTLSDLPNQYKRSFSIPRSIWDEYSEHSYSVLKDGVTQLTLTNPLHIGRSSNGNIFSMSMVDINPSNLQITTGTETTTSCATQTDYSFQLAKNQFKQDFPDGAWNDLCAPIQTVDLGKDPETGFNIIAYLFFPKTRREPLLGPGRWADTLYAEALILQHAKTQEDFLSYLYGSTRVEWTFDIETSPMSEYRDDKDYANQLKKLKNLTDTFFKTVSIAFCANEYAGCY